MANEVTADGLSIQTKAEIVTDLETAFRTIYGDDINLDSDTPDGQTIGIFAQAKKDCLDLLNQIYSSFDPDQAIGRALDERCAINGIQRLGGTYTMQDIEVVVDRALNLVGLDAAIDDPDGDGYTIADNAGNQWILAASQTISGAGTASYAFRSRLSGAVTPTPNTITVPVTIVLGVTSVNNPTVYSTLGIDEETDAQLKIRRQKSVALSSKGYLQGLLAALLNVSGVTAAFVYENVTGSTDADSIPSHSIWCIVAGGDSNHIANAIYSKRNAGCGMKGAVEVSVIQPDASAFLIKFDRTASEDLYLKFTAISLNVTDPIGAAALKAAIVAQLKLGVNEQYDVNLLAALVRSIDPNALLTVSSGQGVGLTGGGTFYNQLRPSAKNKQFAVSAAHITITRRFKFTVTSAAATAGATYTNNGATFTVESTIAGATTLYCTDIVDLNPAASGTLTKTGGTGDATITFSAWSQA